MTRKEDTPEEQRHKPKPGKSYAAFLGIGLQYAVTVVLFWYLGAWLDERFSCEPWGMVGGSFMGIALATYHLLKETA